MFTLKTLKRHYVLFGERGTVKVGGTSTNEIAVWDFADTREEDTQIRTLT